jgi:hypothetical protein
MSSPDVHGWLGRLSMALTIAQPQLPKEERRHAARTLTEFRRSEACGPQLRQLLEQEKTR